MQTVGHNLATEQQQINNLACEKKKTKEMDVEGEWASLKGKGGVAGRHIGVVIF